MSWQNEDKVYLIMWQSRKTGATLSALKKSEFGKNNFVRTLQWMKVDPETIVVVEQERPYKYITASERKGMSL